MKALIYRTFGDPDVLEWCEEWDRPTTGDHQVLVKVIAGSINPKDVLLRKGKFSRTLARDPLPRVSGLDISGEVVAAVGGRGNFKTGDRIYGMTNQFSGGVHSEYAVLDETEIALAPPNISIIHASGIPLSAQTSLQALRDLCKVSPGHSILINGASGGVGHFAVQIAKILGADVHAVCGPSHLDFVTSLGADTVYDYRVEPAHKIDRIFDSVFDVFGKYARKDFSGQLKQKGIFVSTVPGAGNLTGELFARIGLYTRHRCVWVKSSSSDLEQLTQWVASGLLIPHVDNVYSVSEAREAHRHIETRHTTGKVVLSF
ncbi:MAG: NAD(P)-dependent alcohol dehydrogenase [Desulfobacterales bacterium]|nr:NAD(P)-dependent alcohol dehydrogenase [Desulfobacterales bacterium]